CSGFSPSLRLERGRQFSLESTVGNRSRPPRDGYFFISSNCLWQFERTTLRTPPAKNVVFAGLLLQIAPTAHSPRRESPAATRLALPRDATRLRYQRTK